MKQQTLKKTQRLKSKLEIDRLYRSGNTGVVYPFHYSFLIDAAETTRPEIKFMVAVSAKRVKKAVTRNLIKRRVREAFRKNRTIIAPLITATKHHLFTGITFIGDQPINYHTTQEKIIVILQQIKNTLEKLNSNM
ncbi:MAG: ribonuclease P protein component [Bacteroidales bacterium]|nr:ribonuclease P protein component [Bacteroidales bacterium]